MENIENQNQTEELDKIEDLEYKDTYANIKDFRAKVWYLSWNCSKGASKERIEEVFNKNAKQIKKLAYILHNKDLQKDGLPKESHYHVVFICKNACRVSTVHNWFNLPLGLVRVASKKNTFNNLIVYFTHQKYNNNIEKQHYSVNDIVTLGEEVDIQSIVENALNNTPINKKELKKVLKESLLRNEITLREIQEKHPDLYVDDVKKYDEIDRKRVDMLPLPKERINFYITGKGGFGKDFLSTMLSIHLTSIKDDVDIRSLNERVFSAGNPKVALQSYAGQECVIYSDYRAGNLLDCFSGRGGVFNAFDTIPRNVSNNIKYGEVVLKNRLSIVNSVQSFQNFTNTLCEMSDKEIGQLNEEGASYEERQANYEKKKYENKTQVIRRFAFIIVIEENRILLSINKNFLHPNDNLEEYTELEININLRQAIEIIKKASDESQERIFNNARKVLRKFLDVIDNALKTHEERRNYKEENKSELEQLIDSVDCKFIEYHISYDRKEYDKNGIRVLPKDYFDKALELHKELFPKKEVRKDLTNEDNKRTD